MGNWMKMPVLLCSLGILTFECKDGTVGPGPSPRAMTAAYKLSEVDSLAESHAKGLRLMTVISRDVSTDGKSDAWGYMYVDTAIPRNSYWFHSTSTTVVFDSNSATGVGSAVITHRWFDSDSALVIAERNGGSQFRGQNPQYTISASVGEPVVPNPTASWWITYRSKADNTKLLLLAIDANTGLVTMTYP
jgi:hypothetical protein